MVSGAGQKPDIRIFLALAAAAVSVLPLLLVSHLPLVDYPNHLGEFQIYQTMTPGSALARFYQWHWAFIPNLALDLLVIPVSHLLPIEQAANLIILLALIAICGGTMLLDRVLHGQRWGLGLFVGIILYNGAFRYGFVNYIIGIGFALPMFAFWVLRRPKWGAGETFGFTLAGAFLLLMHLFAFGLYAVCVAGYEFSLLLEAARQSGRWRVPPLGTAIAIGASLVLPLTLLALSPTSDQAGVTRWSTLTWKFEALSSPVFFNHPLIELPLLGILYVLAGVGLLTGILKIHPRMIWSLAAFALLVLAMPRTLFGSNYADYRLLGGVSFFFLASLQLDIANASWRYAVQALLLLCLTVRIGSIAVDWVSVQPILDEYESALDPVPAGARVLVLQGLSGSTSVDRTPPLEHVPVFALAKRQAFCAYIFTDTAVPLHLTPAFAPYWQFSPYPEHAKEMANYDYVLVVDYAKFQVPNGLSLVPIKQGMTYVLSRIERH